jgi:hypothetical protein
VVDEIGSLTACYPPNYTVVYRETREFTILSAEEAAHLVSIKMGLTAEWEY